MAKIGIIMSSLYACGGEERVVSLMANEFAKYHDITIFTYENREQEGNNRNDYFLSDQIMVKRVNNVKDTLFCTFIKVLYYHTGMTSGRISSWALRKAYYPEFLLQEWIKRINEEKFDIVVGISGMYSMLLGYIKERVAAKVIGWEHSSFEGYFDPDRGYYKNREQLYRDSASRLDAIVVLNEDIKRKYKQQLGLNATVIYNPKSFSSQGKADMSSRLFVTCGRMEAEKGYDDLIAAFAEFNKQNTDWKLLIIGGGSLQKSLEKQAAEAGIHEKVQITGYVHNVTELLSQGSIFMMTSRWEGFPMSITEALELGLPVIAYDIPAMEPLVTDGTEGRIVPAFEREKLTQAMLELAEDVACRKRMSEAAVQKAALLTPDNINRRWQKLFKNL